MLKNYHIFINETYVSTNIKRDMFYKTVIKIVQKLNDDVNSKHKSLYELILHNIDNYKKISDTPEYITCICDYVYLMATNRIFWSKLKNIIPTLYGVDIFEVSDKDISKVLDDIYNNVDESLFIEVFRMIKNNRLSATIDELGALSYLTSIGLQPKLTPVEMDNKGIDLYCDFSKYAVQVKRTEYSLEEIEKNGAKLTKVNFSEFNRIKRKSSLTLTFQNKKITIKKFIFIIINRSKKDDFIVVNNQFIVDSTNNNITVSEHSNQNKKSVIEYHNFNEYITDNEDIKLLSNNIEKLLD